MIPEAILHPCEFDRWNPRTFASGCIDPEGNLIERGMAAVFEGRTYVIGYAGRSLFERSPWVCLDIDTPKKRERVFLSGRNLRRIHLLGYRLPLVW